MIKLRDHLTALLKTYHQQVHYQTAPSTAPKPYIVYDFLPSFSTDELEVLPMDIDVWGSNSDTTTIETLAATLWKELDHYHHIDEFMQLKIYRETRFPELDEAEIDIRRRKLTFNIRYYDKTL